MSIYQDPDLAGVLESCYTYTGQFGKTFMPETFDRSFSGLHEQMLEAIDSRRKKIVIAAPRNLGKTTTVRTYCLKEILYRAVEFVLYVSNSESAAELQTENIKRELLTNTQIRKMFGDVKITDEDVGFDETFSKRAWSAYGNTLVLPRGSGQQVRGLVYKRFRPQLIVVDDLEKRDEMDNPEIRKKIKGWFFSDLVKCVNRYDNNWRIVYIDTLKHEDSLLEQLLNSKDWYALRLDLCDDEYNSNVPELITSEELKIEAAQHRDDGTLDIFYMEYRNLPVSKENRSFKESYFKYYDERELNLTNIENIIIVDPAKTIQMQNADSAIVGVGVDYKSGAMYVRDIVAGKMFPDEIYEQMFQMRRRLKAHAVGIEVTGLEEFIKQPILNEMSKRPPGDSFEPVWLKARMGTEDERGKLKRIGALVPYYRQGYVYHNPANCALLESQLISFPRGKRVDVSDALAYVIEMLELGSRYFTHPEAESEEEQEQEYEDLEYDDPLDDTYLRV